MTSPINRGLKFQARLVLFSSFGVRSVVFKANMRVSKFAVQVGGGQAAVLYTAHLKSAA